MVKVDIKQLKELKPGCIYALEISKEVDMSIVFDMLEKVSREYDVHFLCYEKGSMKFINPKKEEESHD